MKCFEKFCAGVKSDFQRGGPLGVKFTEFDNSSIFDLIELIFQGAGEVEEGY